MEVIIFSKIVGVICSLAMVLSGRSQTSVNPEPTHNEDGIASELRAEIGGSFGKNSVNSGKMTVEKDGSSTTSHDSEPSSKCSSHDLGPETPHSENNPASDVYIQIDVLESVSNNGNVSSEVESASPASDVSKTDYSVSGADKAASSVSEVSKVVYPAVSVKMPHSSPNSFEFDDIRLLITFEYFFDVVSVVLAVNGYYEDLENCERNFKEYEIVCLKLYDSIKKELKEIYKYCCFIADSEEYYSINEIKRLFRVGSKVVKLNRSRHRPENCEKKLKKRQIIGLRLYNFMKKNSGEVERCYRDRKDDEPGLSSSGDEPGKRALWEPNRHCGSSEDCSSSDSEESSSDSESLLSSDLEESSSDSESFSSSDLEESSSDSESLLSSDFETD